MPSPELRTSAFRRAPFTAVAAVALALASVLVSATPAGAAVPTLTRQAGVNRYATAAAISRATFAPGVPVAYVATGTNFPDALAAGPAAAKLGGPLLLVTKAAIPAETGTELDRLNPGKIIIVGGTGVVSTTVGSALRTYCASVTREAGANRYATAAAIATAHFGPGISVVYIATGANFPDALAAGPAAAKAGGALLLVAPTGIPAETASALSKLKPARIVIAGGTGVVSSAIASKLAAYGPVTRRSGADRYATAAAISAGSFGSMVPAAHLATGANFPDALAAGPAAAKLGGPVLLVPPTSIPSPVAGELRRLAPTKLVVAGGTAIVPTRIANAAVRLLISPSGPTQTGTVTYVVDGDTIDVNIGGTVYRVRYIGMDTPEIYSGVEWLGPEAKNYNASLVAGKTVVLEKDVSETDRYGRLLRYIWIQSGGGWLLVNLELIRTGYATVTTYPPDVKYVDSLYLPAQKDAQAAHVGLWGTQTSPPPPSSSSCDAAYPTVCIPPPPPDLDCGEITYRNFTVLAPDPHGFDADHDGIGCES
jgi:putative cell wall-binding protein